MSSEGNIFYPDLGGDILEDRLGKIKMCYDCDIIIISYNYMQNKLYGINRRYNAFLSLNC